MSISLKESESDIQIYKETPMTTIPSQIHLILAEVRAELNKLYADRIMGVILFGSYARGEWSEGSVKIDLIESYLMG